MAAGLAPRPYLIEEYTRTVCPHCFATAPKPSSDPRTFVDGMLVSHDNSVWMRRFCPVHGETESLYEEDLALWKARSGWVTPTLKITPDRAGNFAGFPEGYREGLPASHGQHTCILLLNVTEHCNYKCSTCYASALAPGTALHSDSLPSLDDIENTVTTVIARENGKLGVLMISGGEPTVRADFEELLCRVMDLNITRVMINTNGRRIAKDDSLLAFMQKHRDRIEVYLQFDGFRPSTYEALRSEDVANEKLTALNRLNQAGIYTTLVMTVNRGINEDEVGQVITHGLGIPKCAGVAIQPMFGSGRVMPFNPMNRVTPTGILSKLAEQTNGLVTAEDFIPLPCSHRDCCDITYFLRSSKGEWRSLPKLIGREELKNWIHLVSNTISFENASDAVKQMLKSGVLQRVFSEQQKTSALALASDMLRMCDCAPGVMDLLGGMWAKVRGDKSGIDKVAESTFRITAKMFMDAHTFHEARVRQCCVHTGTFEEDPRRHSFCWRWMFPDASDFPTRNLTQLEQKA
ncbi:MAG TPA: radical SAM protein [Fimbriimonadaceae bacterium]|jgi:hypothetical protein